MTNCLIRQFRYFLCKLFVAECPQSVRSNIVYYFSVEIYPDKNILICLSDFSLRNYDAYHGEIQLNTEASKGITSILMGPAGGIVLGIDYSRRIVYWGDTDIGSSASSSTSTTDNRINNNSGTINNASKLIANVFAWIAETVLYGE